MKSIIFTIFIQSIIDGKVFNYLLIRPYEAFFLMTQYTYISGYYLPNGLGNNNFSYPIWKSVHNIFFSGGQKMGTLLDFILNVRYQLHSYLDKQLLYYVIVSCTVFTVVQSKVLPGINLTCIDNNYLLLMSLTFFSVSFSHRLILQI